MAKDGEDWQRKQQEQSWYYFSKLTHRHSMSLTHTHNSSMHSSKVLSLEISAWENLHGGQFTSSTQLIKPNYLVILQLHSLINFVLGNLI